MRCVTSSSMSPLPWITDPRYLKFSFLGMICVASLTSKIRLIQRITNLHPKYSALVLLNPNPSTPKICLHTSNLAINSPRLINQYYVIRNNIHHGTLRLDGPASKAPGCRRCLCTSWAWDGEAKKLFYENLDEVVRGIPNTEKIVIGGDFNGHIGATSSGFDDVHEGFGFGERNGGGISLLEFAKAFELVIANSCFSKKENHMVTFRSSVSKTQIDYLLLRKGDRCVYKDGKVIPSENLTTQHKLLVMDLEIKRDRRKKIVSD
ncbi:hypothetical protein H5410_031220 [Solanum commersonii]|uniref:Craniofacial development protein 2-like n=1 Tax=Solanum commersonii TaxID=4109 RepID=A0A9J5YHS2_SOLCO|nr:hypothetical protein H5410_031220 [Solanum commersonii]